MDRDQLQARWIVSQGWLSEAALRSLAAQRDPRDGDDLCGWLARAGHLPEAACQQARAATRTNAEPRRPPPTSFEQTQLEIEDTRSKLLSAPTDQVPALRAVPMKRAGFSSDASGDELEDYLKLGEVAPELKRILNYRVEGEISRGSMGVILRAREEGSNRPVALKLVVTGPGKEREYERLQREAQVLVGLKHPNIVEIRDVGYEGQHFVLSMEYVHGFDLKATIDAQRGRNETADWTQTARQFARIAEAVAYCHKNGVLHRDIKPQNIIIEHGTERPVLIDFGLIKRERVAATKTTGTSQPLTGSGELLGTPAFMSPEQFVPGGEFGAVGTASDVWSLGASIYYALAGLPPYNYTNSVSIFQAMTQSDPPRLSSMAPGVPEWLEHLVESCLLREAELRPSAAEVAATLRRHVLLDTTRRQLPRLALIAATLVGAVGAWILLGPSSERIVEARVTAARTRDSKTLISGRLNRAGAVVINEGMRVVSDEDGRFRARVDLDEGLNRFRLRFGSEESGHALDLSVRRDSEAPRLSIDPEESAIPDGRFATNSEGWFSGVCRDANPPIRLSINGQAVTDFDEDGRFRFILQDRPEPQAVEFSLIDALENRELRTLVFLTPSAARGAAEARRVKDQAPLWATLRDQAAWSYATAEVQDTIIALVGERLGSEFESVETRTYRCGYQRFRIAVFRHKRSDVRLSLIPGGRQRIQWWTSPDAEIIHELLRVITRSELDASLVEKCFEFPIFEAYRDRIAEALGKDKTTPSAELARLLTEDDGLRRKLRGFFETFRRSLKDQFETSVASEVVEPFLLGQTELTRGQWRHIASLVGKPTGDDPALPVCEASYNQILSWLGKTGSRLRLPNRVEWQYACASGAKTDFFWGDRVDGGRPYRWTEAEAGGKARRVTEHLPYTNAFGLSDMLGNAAEWCDPALALWRRQWREEDEEGERPVIPWKVLNTDWETMNRRNAALMGGSARSHPKLCRTALFYYHFRDVVEGLWGFRVAVSIPDMPPRPE